jgi:hypothetical protein
MLNRIFPEQFDNNYNGQWLAVWLLVPVVLFRAAQGVNSLFNTHLVMTTADGIPVDSYSSAAAETATALFALLGLQALVLPLLSIVAVIRYRSMVPLMYLLLLFVQAGGRLVAFLHPIARSATYEALPVAFYVNSGFWIALLLGFALSLVNRGRSSGKSTSPG